MPLITIALTTAAAADAPRPKHFTTWMGGDRPKKLGSVSGEERALVSAEFRQQCKTHARYWDLTIAWDTARTFWRRARYDAHATFNLR